MAALNMFLGNVGILQHPAHLLAFFVETFNIKDFLYVKSLKELLDKNSLKH